MSRRAPQVVVALVALFGIVAVVLGVRGHGGAGAERSAGQATPGAAATLPQATPAEEAERAARLFLDTYVQPDGRVRRDADSDTVSEGQAYAMLLAVATGDGDRFARVWAWTKANLMRPNGSLAWHWVNGTIVDPNAATDADIDAARALLLAAQRFHQPSYQADGTALAATILDQERVDSGAGPLLVAGPWAHDLPYTLNPSYVSPVAFEQFAAEGGDTRWRAVRDASIALLESLTADGERLPSDWARLERSGAADVASAPGGAAVGYGYDAFRTLPRLAESCDVTVRQFAGRLGGATERTVREPARIANLDGSPQQGGANPLFLIGAAAAANAGGDDQRADALLDEADQHQRQSPSYYLAAWVALGRVMLDTTALGGCGTGGAT